MAEIWSFDIFDTCLVRRYAFPSDVFIDLGESLKALLQPVLGVDYREVFREARVEAERLALLRLGHEEVTLVEIWQELVELIPELNLQTGMACELALEAATLLPVPAALALVKQGGAHHGRVAFISDTYFPRIFITEQLQKHGFLQQHDELILSSELRATKRSGKLYPLALDLLQVPGNAMKHHGDNLHSDVKMAAAAGLRTIHLQEGLLTDHEREVGSRLKHLDSRYAATLVGTMREARITGAPAPNAAARSLVSTFIGPFLWIFAEWILRRAAADGIRRLYFFSRDCHGLYRVARVLSDRLNLGIECRYLRVSRQALLLPSVTEISPAGIPWLRRSWETCELGAVLDKLDIASDEAYACLHGLTGPKGNDFRLTTDDHWHQFWTALGEAPLQGMLKARISQRREAALAYFEQQGLLDGVRVGVVDLGWHQSCQAALAKLLRMANAPLCVPAYYLALVDGRGAYLKGCPAQAVFHRPPGDRRAGGFDEPLFARIPVLEHVLNCAPHGSTHHYELQGATVPTVVVVEKPTPDAESEVKALLYEEVALFADQFIRPLDLSDHSARDALAALLDAAASKPLAEWATLLRCIEVADDQNNRDASSMVKTRGLAHLVGDGIRGRDYHSLPWQVAGIWPELSLAGNSSGVAAAYRRLEQLNRVRRFVKNALTR